MEELIEQKMTTVLNLIRTNNSADEALKITQAFLNMAHGKVLLREQDRTMKPKGASA